jgi:hypothetical protein
MKFFKAPSLALVLTLTAFLTNEFSCAGMLTNTPEEIPITDQVQKQEAEEILHCNQELLINYGLKGYGEPTITNHKYCPSIVQNCCTDDDEERSNAIWTADIQPVVER